MVLLCLEFASWHTSCARQRRRKHRGDAGAESTGREGGSARRPPTAAPGGEGGRARRPSAPGPQPRRLTPAAAREPPAEKSARGSPPRGPRRPGCSGRPARRLRGGQARPRRGLALGTRRGRSRPRLPGQRRRGPRPPSTRQQGPPGGRSAEAALPRPQGAAREAKFGRDRWAANFPARSPARAALGPSPLGRPPAQALRARITYSGCSRSDGASAAAMLNFLTPRQRWRRLRGRRKPGEAEEERTGPSRMCR